MRMQTESAKSVYIGVLSVTWISQRPAPSHQIKKLSVGQIQTLMNVMRVKTKLFATKVMAGRLRTRQSMINGTMLNTRPTNEQIPMSTALGESGRATNGSGLEPRLESILIELWFAIAENESPESIAGKVGGFDMSFEGTGSNNGESGRRDPSSNQLE